jgi:hypothetical protein
MAGGGGACGLGLASSVSVAAVLFVVLFGDMVELVDGTVLSISKAWTGLVELKRVCEEKVQ